MKYNPNTMALDLIATIIFSMSDPHISKGVLNSTHNCGPYSGGDSNTNFDGHESHQKTKDRQEKILKEPMCCQE
jgi:hypothetical protein